MASVSIPRGDELSDALKAQLIDDLSKSPVRKLSKEEREIYGKAIVKAVQWIPAFRDALALMRPYMDASAPTAYTDPHARVGLSYWFFYILNDAQRASVLLHECMHVLNNHFQRREEISSLKMDPQLFNLAGDFEINTVLYTVRFVDLSEGQLPDRAPNNYPPNKTMEIYADLLAKDLKKAQDDCEACKQEKQDKEDAKNGKAPKPEKKPGEDKKSEKQDQSDGEAEKAGGNDGSHEEGDTEDADSGDSDGNSGANTGKQPGNSSDKAGEGENGTQPGDSGESAESGEGDAEGEGSGEGDGDGEGSGEGQGDAPGQGAGKPSHSCGKGDGEGEGDGEGSGEGQGQGQGRPGQGQGQPGKGKPGGWNCGNSDEETEAAADDAGIQKASDVEVTIAKQNTAARIVEERNTGGMGTGTNNEFWDSILKHLTPAKVDWRKIFRRIVASSVDSITKGRSDYTYRRVSRRLQSRDFVFPGMLSYLPKVTLAVDTSGSMGDEDFQRALTEIEGILKEVARGKDAVSIFSVDTQASNISPVTSVKKIRFHGGGGTVMAVAWQYVKALPKTKQPDIFILVTDGFIDWHDVEREVRDSRFKSVICVTQQGGFQSAPESLKKFIPVLDISEDK